MFYKILAVSALLVGTLGLAPASMASVDTMEKATVVVYRAAEPSKNRRVSMYLHGNEGSIGRLNSNASIVTLQPAGSYTLGSSIKGTEPLTLDLKPGQTYYVHADMKLNGTKAKVSFSQVEEQVAKVQQPVLAGPI